MSLSYPIRVTVGTAGATIDAVDGLTLVIPSGALSANTVITIAAPVTAPSLTGLTVVSGSYAIGPVGTSLASRATVYVPYDSHYESQRSSIKVYFASTPDEPDPGGWTPGPQDLTVSGKVGGTMATLQCALAAIPN